MEEIFENQIVLYVMLTLTKEKGGKSMEERKSKLFMAHHPEKDFVNKNCNHYFYKNISIVEILSDSEHVTEPFQHAHDAYEFLVPYGPLPAIMHRDAVYFGEPGYVYPIQSQREHAFKVSVTGISHDNIVVEKEYMDQLIQISQYAGQEFDTKVELTQELSMYIKLFKEVCKKEKPEKIREKKLQNLMELICLELIYSAFCEERVRKEELWQYQQGILSVAAYMNQHYKEKIEIGELAKMAGFSKNYFISSFKKFMGEPPHTYLSKLRVAYAKVLLETGTHTVSEIAGECGFRKANTFSAIFKKETGVSPSAYRKERGRKS